MYSSLTQHGKRTDKLNSHVIHVMPVRIKIKLKYVLGLTQFYPALIIAEAEATTSSSTTCDPTERTWNKRITKESKEAWSAAMKNLYKIK